MVFSCCCSWSLHQVYAVVSCRSRFIVRVKSGAGQEKRKISAHTHTQTAILFAVNEKRWIDGRRGKLMNVHDDAIKHNFLAFVCVCRGMQNRWTQNSGTNISIQTSSVEGGGGSLHFAQYVYKFDYNLWVLTFASIWHSKYMLSFGFIWLESHWADSNVNHSAYSLIKHAFSKTMRCCGGSPMLRAQYFHFIFILFVFVRSDSTSHD